MLGGDTLHAIEPAAAQSNPDATEQAIPAGAQKTADHPTDEITVIGQETAPRLRHKLRRLDEAFFKRYNELNDVDDYDMICKRETRIGSQIPRTVCRSRWHRQRLSESATDMLNENGIMWPVSESWPSRHYDKLRDKVRRSCQKCLLLEPNCAAALP